VSPARLIHIDRRERNLLPRGKLAQQFAELGLSDMDVAQVAPLAEPVPPKLYGGTERVVSWLTEELIAQGHKVTLFASGDSITRASLVPVVPRATRLRRPRPDPSVVAALLLEAVTEAADEFDVIHFHIDWIHLPLMHRLSTPFLTTCHGRLDLPSLPQVIQQFPSAPFISISNSQRAPLPEAHWLGTVYHGMPPDLYRPSFEQGNYLAFLGRITPDKGPSDAIKIAREAGLPLRIAAKLPRQQGHYFKEELEPLIDGQQVQFTGELEEQGKGQLLRNAAALLFPIDWPEPFGLVMIEAMACGTPVIAYPRGSVPEVIEHGVTGFIVEVGLLAGGGSGKPLSSVSPAIEWSGPTSTITKLLFAAQPSVLMPQSRPWALRSRTALPVQTREADACCPDSPRLEREASD
jgi:glycosyltransferase involved in cell wall biosynthesis